MAVKIVTLNPALTVPDSFGYGFQAGDVKLTSNVPFEAPEEATVSGGFMGAAINNRRGLRSSCPRYAVHTGRAMVFERYGEPNAFGFSERVGVVRETVLSGADGADAAHARIGGHAPGWAGRIDCYAPFEVSYALLDVETSHPLNVRCRRGGVCRGSRCCYLLLPEFPGWSCRSFKVLPLEKAARPHQIIDTLNFYSHNVFGQNSGAGDMCNETCPAMHPLDRSLPGTRDPLSSVPIGTLGDYERAL